VLRVVLELDHVKVAIVAPHQVRLRPAPHSTYMLHRPGHEGGILPLLSRASIRDTCQQ
jgi:hypothetical protein